MNAAGEYPLDYPLTEGRPRILMAKIGLDGHDAGLRRVSRALRDAGLEVVYLGIQQTPEAIASAALQEDVDLIGLSSLSGVHVSLVRQVMAKLKDIGLATVPPVVLGGTIPERDIAELKALGIREVFPSGSNMDVIIELVTGLVCS